MIMIYFFVFSLALLSDGVFGVENRVKDSYLDAYSVVHEINSKKPTKNDRDFKLGNDFHGGYGEGPVYQQEYPYPEAVIPSYYGPPKPAYGPPVHQSYGPPPPAPVYSGPLYEVPHAMLGLLDKLKFKIDLFTIGKIILKLVIFKKIVSLIAILCLLLFIPSLKHKEQESNSEETDSMMRSSHSGNEKINTVTAFVLEAIQEFPNTLKNKTCRSFSCKNKKFSKYFDKFSYRSLAPLYLEELKSSI